LPPELHLGLTRDSCSRCLARDGPRLARATCAATLTPVLFDRLKLASELVVRYGDKVPHNHYTPGSRTVKHPNGIKFERGIVG
jgi:hypothetical protein